MTGLAIPPLEDSLLMFDKLVVEDDWDPFGNAKQTTSSEIKGDNSKTNENISQEGDDANGFPLKAAIVGKGTPHHIKDCTASEEEEEEKCKLMKQISTNCQLSSSASINEKCDQQEVHDSASDEEETIRVPELRQGRMDADHTEEQKNKLQNIISKRRSTRGGELTSTTTSHKENNQHEEDDTEPFGNDKGPDIKGDSNNENEKPTQESGDDTGKGSDNEMEEQKTKLQNIISKRRSTSCGQLTSISSHGRSQQKEQQCSAVTDDEEETKKRRRERRRGRMDGRQQNQQHSQSRSNSCNRSVSPSSGGIIGKIMVRRRSTNSLGSLRQGSGRNLVEERATKTSRTLHHRSKSNDRDGATSKRNANRSFSGWSDANQEHTPKQARGRSTRPSRSLHHRSISVDNNNRDGGRSASKQSPNRSFSGLGDDKREHSPKPAQQPKTRSRSLHHRSFSVDNIDRVGGRSANNQILSQSLGYDDNRRSSPKPARALSQRTRNNRSSTSGGVGLDKATQDRSAKSSRKKSNNDKEAEPSHILMRSSSTPSLSSKKRQFQSSDCDEEANKHVGANKEDRGGGLRRAGSKDTPRSADSGGRRTKGQSRRVKKSITAKHVVEVASSPEDPARIRQAASSSALQGGAASDVPARIQRTASSRTLKREAASEGVNQMTRGASSSSHQQAASEVPARIQRTASSRTLKREAASDMSSDSRMSAEAEGVNQMTRGTSSNNHKQEKSVSKSGTSRKSGTGRKDRANSSNKAKTHEVKRRHSTNTSLTSIVRADRKGANSSDKAKAQEVKRRHSTNMGLTSSSAHEKRRRSTSVGLTSSSAHEKKATKGMSRATTMNTGEVDPPDSVPFQCDNSGRGKIDDSFSSISTRGHSSDDDDFAALLDPATTQARAKEMLSNLMGKLDKISLNSTEGEEEK